jgi:hypothetical protein
MKHKCWSGESDKSKLNRFEIHLKVIEHYGEITQIGKCQEELRELSDELSNCVILSGTGTKEALISEIADVLNTLEQQCFIHSIKPHDIQIQQDMKMQRTLERINK